MRREIVAQGCNCSARIIPVEIDALAVAVEAIIGSRTESVYDIHHQPWCPAGQAHQASCDAGIRPVIVFNSAPGCER